MVFKVTATPLERFSTRYEVNSAGCWIWQGTTAAGYGQFWIGKTKYGAHRMAYLLFRGEIPKGLLVCHRCDVKRCCNPDHLFLGTYSDNALDMVAKGRGLVGSLNGRAKLTREQVEEIERSSETRPLARRLGITPGRICQIRRAARKRLCP